MSRWYFKFKDFKVIEEKNSKVLRSKIFCKFDQMHISDLFKLSKQVIYILITKIQIYMSKSCYPNAHKFDQLMRLNLI